MPVRCEHTGMTNVYIALIRGINVGGSHLLPMKDVKLLFEQHGCAEVQTYIQSGNVVFRSTDANAGRLARRVTAAVAKARGFEPRLLVLTRHELERAAAGNPFPEADDNPASVHLFFLAEPAKDADVKSMHAVKTATERFVLKGRVLYLHTPDGVGSSKLAARAERLLGVAATARNWRTVTTLLELSRK
jgi:uncharacterized protein (DUF1697 family)